MQIIPSHRKTAQNLVRAVLLFARSIIKASAKLISMVNVFVFTLVNTPNHTAEYTQKPILGVHWGVNSTKP